MGNQSKYKNRKAHRMNGHAAEPRPAHKYLAEFLADFLARDREQAEAARNGPLSTDPLRPWGSRKGFREVEELEAVEEVKVV